jgi:fatty-acyl-CoA synthase
MKALSNLQRDAKFLSGALSLLKWTKGISPDSDFLVPDDFERAVDEHEIRIAFRFEGRLTTYASSMPARTAMRTGRCSGA